MEQHWLERLKWWLCEKVGHNFIKEWHYNGYHHAECKWCGRTISKKENHHDLPTIAATAQEALAQHADEDEKNQLMLETFISGNVGQQLMAVNPAGFFKAASLTVRSMKTKHSLNISEILDETAMAIAGGRVAPPTPDGQSPQQGSSQLKLPQNTNEGL